jgi:hypothetical protein
VAANSTSRGAYVTRRSRIKCSARKPCDSTLLGSPASLEGEPGAGWVVQGQIPPHNGRQSAAQRAAFGRVIGPFGGVHGPNSRTAAGLTSMPSSRQLARSSLSSHVPSWRGAGDGARTHDIQLGKLTLYQLSYARVCRGVAAAREGSLRGVEVKVAVFGVGVCGRWSGGRGGA